MKNTWLEANSICLAQGESVALNLMFENQKDHELFLQYWKKYLSKMATLINYHLTPAGWTLLFRSKSAKEIEAAYLELRSTSKKAKKKHTLTQASKMLSEHFRIFLSQFVKRTNTRHQRKGTKVKQRFQKYILRDTSEYEELFDMLTRQKRRESQSRRKYRADETKYDQKGELDQESKWRVGTRVYKGLEEGFRKWLGMELVLPKSDVLRNYLQTKYNPNFPPPFS